MRGIGHYAMPGRRALLAREGGSAWLCIRTVGQRPFASRYPTSETWCPPQPVMR
jgi:hypothetical protein